jgi:hypothetical protein
VLAYTVEVSDRRFKSAIERFDALNAQDPDGDALLYSQRMTAWLKKFAPDASEALQLAARAQHLMRWSIPRTQFPATRTGYLQWRTILYDFQADHAADVLRELGYDDATIARVRGLIRKEKLKADAQMQTLEDVACLVFLQHYFADFAASHEEEKLIRILQRTWKKMSVRGREFARKIHHSADERRVIEKALAPPPGG